MVRAPERHKTLQPLQVLPVNLLLMILWIKTNNRLGISAKFTAIEAIGAALPRVVRCEGLMTE
jgi:hypothetical protein